MRVVERAEEPGALRGMVRGDARTARVSGGRGAGRSVVAARPPQPRAGGDSRLRHAALRRVSRLRPVRFLDVLRFLLPGFPIAFLLSADVVRELATPLGRAGRAVAMLLFAVATIGAGASQSDGRNVLDLGGSEQKFADVGRFVGETLPANAVVYAQQHGGNVRFYSNRLTLRFDILDPDWLDRSIEHLRGAGYVPYFLLEEWEVPQFRQRFVGQRSLAVLERSRSP